MLTTNPAFRERFEDAVSKMQFRLDGSGLFWNILEQHKIIVTTPTISFSENP